MAIASTPEQFEKKVEKTDSMSYPNLAESIKEEVQEHVEEVVQNADAETKAILQDNVNEMAQEIDKVSETEERYTPHPDTWKDLKKNEIALVHNALDDLGHYIGRSVENTKGSLSQQKEQAVQKVTKVVSAVQKVNERLRQRQEEVEKEAVDMREQLIELQNSMLQLNKLIGANDSPEVQKSMKETMEYMTSFAKEFAEIYKDSRMKKRTLVPAVAHEAIESSVDAVKKVNDSLKVQASLAKTAVRMKSQSLIERIAKRVKDTMKKAKAYMSELHQDMKKAIAKGKTTIEDFRHIHVGIHTFDDRDLFSSREEAMADRFVKEHAKNGDTMQATKEDMQNLVKNFTKQVEKVMQKDKYKTTFQTNEVAMARA